MKKRIDRIRLDINGQVMDIEMLHKSTPMCEDCAFNTYENKSCPSNYLDPVAIISCSEYKEIS